ncbi:Clp protease N-terminal domain-containing protein [Streptomyces sp. TG1A-8]|uniref:Clp protease N-terminal domain-containing protein n=1 Tax=Streptomyces sp. TG1A-8 TaxID=3051385 RepID=UPI00265B8140|nr:Clp protease N-terminal domain-containing protein [Streptomyces sp. TG1A-8]MDO0928735.1 Clp protease N-terminal domain-containing protein [Streptomyces sp. TG1A-8]
MTRRAPEQSGPRTDQYAGLSAELAAVLAGARRRAVRDGDRQADTAHLLHSLLEADPEVRAAVAATGQLARLLGYLVQRSIGYGLRWQGAVEDSGPLPAVPGPGAAGDSGTFPAVPGPAHRGAGRGDAGDWSPAAAAALAEARRSARRRGAAVATGTDLLAVLVVDPRSRAVEVLERAGIPRGDLRGRTGGRAPQRTGDGSGGALPSTP